MASKAKNEPPKKKPNPHISRFRKLRSCPASESQRQGVDIRTLIILAFSATAGVLVEFYDFYIYGYAAATAFPAIFFPKLPPTQALVFSYLAFAAGFPARVLGAFIFGHFGDLAFTVRPLKALADR